MCLLPELRCAKVALSSRSVSFQSGAFAGMSYRLRIVDVRPDLRYSTDHEWVRVETTADGAVAVRVGITAYAQDALGDVVFIELPEVGQVVESAGSLGEVESTKSVSDLYAPVSGTIAEVNTDLVDKPERINEDPYGDGWICVLTPTDVTDVESLLDADAYRQLIEG